jgi:hypothetical protein
MLRTQPDLRFLGLWMLATLAAAAFAASMLEILQGWEWRLIVVLLLGLPVGFLQSMVLRPYFRADIRVTWIAGTALGWAAAMFLLLISTILVMGGSGINAVSESSIRQCLLQTWLVAGGFAGLVQALYWGSRAFSPVLWGGVNALAWGAGGLVGANTSQALGAPVGETWFESLGTTTMLPVAIGVYGVVTGIAVLLVLRDHWRSENLGPAPEST